MFDISNSNLTNIICNYQSDKNINNGDLPDIITKLLQKISNELNIPIDNVFLQIIDMNRGGFIKPHYDYSIDGFINYKCNISILSDEYNLYLDKEKLAIKQFDMYCFEASLFKHYTDEFSNRRILLSFGFILPYQNLNRNDNDVRVRLSKRICKYFTK